MYNLSNNNKKNKKMMIENNENGCKAETMPTKKDCSLDRRSQYFIYSWSIYRRVHYLTVKLSTIGWPNAMCNITVSSSIETRF